MRFDGKTALVTGGTRGIGFAVARKLENLGADVTVWGRSIVDVRDESAIAERAQSFSPDIVVNSAGVFGPMKPAIYYSTPDWEEVINVNLRGTFLVCKYFAPGMVSRSYGRIVNLSSVVGRDANPMAPAYSAAKAGVIRYTQALGRSLATTGVLANCVAPSACLTDLFKDAPQSQLDVMLAKVPMGRFATVEEIAELVCWLASEDMTYSTGAVFDCSGGRHD